MTLPASTLGSLGFPRGFLVFVAAVFLYAGHARAVTQPDGTMIPVTSQLQDLFTARHEAIVAQRDAAILPERYLPGCTLTFTLVSRGMATFQDAFGWYNARTPPARPDPSDLHVLIPCTAHAGDSFTLDMRHEPAYRGGEIGFFLITPQGLPSTCASLTTYAHTYFSERAWNDDAMGANSYIHLLTYDSTVTPQAFYFAWEDLYNGGDNNFTDFVALVQNLTCTGGGGSCDTGLLGVCAMGTRQCHDGALVCTASVQPSPERCDGLDNDCNGRVDDGPGLCPGVQICDRGNCVAPCLSELGCFTPLVCSPRGTCIEPDCLPVTCPAGQRCMGGTCVDPCTWVVWPGDQICRGGRCVNPCAGVPCDADQVCVSGVCQPLCQCRPCAADQTCSDDGVCRPTVCATVTCGMGQICTAGVCVDACAGAHCPVGEVCSLGNCVPPPGVDGGVSGTDAGGDAALDAPGVVAMDAATDVGAFDATPEMDAATSYVPRVPQGCSCNVAGGGLTYGGWALALGVSVLGVRRRKSRPQPHRGHLRSGRRPDAAGKVAP